MMDLPRHLSAYYPLLLPLLLVGAGQAVIVRRRWWRVIGWGRGVAGRAGGGADAGPPVVAGADRLIEARWRGSPASGCCSGP